MKISDKRGSLLVVVLCSFAVLAIVGGLLMLSMTSYRLTARNEFRARARAVAESELEHLYYLFQDQIVCGTGPDAVPGVLAALAAVDNAVVPTTSRSPYLTLHRGDWTVRRSMHFDTKFKGIDADTGDVGTSYYVEVRVEVLPKAGSPWAGTPIRYARQFSASISTVFQTCIFYQGDLEFAPGGSLTIEGAIIANGSIYMGASSGGSLTLKGDISYLKGYGFNTDPGDDGVFGTSDDSGVYSTYRKPDTPAGSTLTAPTFYYSQDQQLEVLDEEVNLLGGLDVTTIQLNYSDLFPTENDVYRSVIVPPTSAGNTNEYSDLSLTDPAAVSAQRFYSISDLVITVESSGTYTVTYTYDTGATVDLTAAFAAASAITTSISMYDQREERNVTVTQVDLAKVAALVGYGTSYGDFDGTMYVNLKSGTATSPSAVRLVNAEKLPLSGDDGLGGFSFVTNGGLYVKGDYNTTLLSDASTAQAMLMSDAITVLSDAWSDANASNTDVTARTAGTNLELNAAIMTGSTSATSTTYSGGAQNLVRYLEDWSGKTVTYGGSFGRLFESKMFCRPFQQPGTVYIQPSNRIFKFDEGLVAGDGPPGSLKNYRTSRGRFYQW